MVGGTRGAVRTMVFLLAASCGGEAPAPSPPPVPPAPVLAPAPAIAAPPPSPAPAPGADDRLPFEREKDPVQARTLREFENLRLDPLLADRNLRICGFRPFVVAVEETPEGNAGEAAAEAGKTLAAAYAAFRAFLGDLAGMEVPLLEDIGDERIRVLLFTDDASFGEWHRTSRLSREAASTAYYRMDGTRRILASRQDLKSRDLGRLATFALLHQYQRHFVQLEDDAFARKEGRPVEQVTWDDNRLPCSYSWLDRGLADHIGQLSEKGGAAGGSGPPVLEHPWAECLRIARKTGEAWDLESYLYADRGQVIARAKQRKWGEWERLRAIHEAQSCVLFRTLLEGEDGRWRAGLGRLLRNLLEGKSGQIYLLESFGLPKRPKDPKIAAWIAEVEAACLRTEEDLFSKSGK